MVWYCLWLTAECVYWLHCKALCLRYNVSWHRIYICNAGIANSFQPEGFIQWWPNFHSARSTRAKMEGCVVTPHPLSCACAHTQTEQMHISPTDPHIHLQIHAETEWAELKVGKLRNRNLTYSSNPATRRQHFPFCNVFDAHSIASFFLQLIFHQKKLHHSSHRLLWQNYIIYIIKNIVIMVFHLINFNAKEMQFKLVGDIISYISFVHKNNSSNNEYWSYLQDWFPF